MSRDHALNLPSTPAIVPEGAAGRLSLRQWAPGFLHLFWMSLAHYVRSKRIFILAFLFALPSVIALLAHHFDEPARIRDPEAWYGQGEKAMMFFLIPHALVPLTALLFASGMIQDEIEGQTLTYLLLRPLPRWSIYLAKLLAAVVISAVVAGIFTFITYTALTFSHDEFVPKYLPMRAMKVMCLYSISLWVYTSLFGLLSLLFKRTLVIGVVYVIVFEGAIANIDFLVRRATVMYYFRVIAARWLDLSFPEWSITLAEASSTAECFTILVSVTVVATVLAGILFTTREFRVKTPEGN